MSERLLTSLRQVVANPAANPRAAVLVFAIVAVLVMILVLMVVLLLIRYRERRAWAEWEAWEAGHPEDVEGAPIELVPGWDENEYEYPELVPALPAQEQTPVRRSPFGSLLRRSGLWVAAAMVGTALIIGYVGSGTTGFCAGTCHSGDAVATLHAADPHSQVDCTRCHEDAPPLGLPSSLVLRSSHMLQKLIGGLHTYAGPVPSTRCLACHDNIGKGLAISDSSGVRMDHSQPIAAGMSCDDCHLHAGHHAAADLPRMSTCLTCHDGHLAPSRCASCHTRDVGLLSASSRRLFSRINLPQKVDCGACHVETTCDACHGIRLPHPDRFTAWGHASVAAFQGKSACERCHVRRDCLKCHGEFTGPTAAHGPAWRTNHANNPFNAQCYCHWSRLPAEAKMRGSYCAVCHPQGRPGGGVEPTTPPAASTNPTTTAP